MTKAPITSGRAVRDHVAAGWELWHISDSPIPGRWELRRRHESRPVHWDAIERVRRHYLDWFRERTVEEQVGRYTWCYRPLQPALRGMTA